MQNYSSELGFNDFKFPYAYGENKIYFMLHRKHILFQEYETSTMENEYELLYKKYKDLKGDNITDEYEGIFEYVKDFLNCKITSEKILIKWTIKVKYVINLSNLRVNQNILNPIIIKILIIVNI